MHSFEHIFPAGAHEAEFWLIQDGFFGFMPFAVATKAGINWPYQHPLIFRLQQALEADDCTGDTCLCRSSNNPIACQGYYGNNGVHEKKAAEGGMDLGITIPFPGTVEQECRLVFEDWVNCITKQYTYVEAEDGVEWIRTVEPIAPGNLTDRCAAPRNLCLDTCKDGWLEFDSLTRGVWALWQTDVTGANVTTDSTSTFTKAQIGDFFKNYPDRYPVLSKVSERSERASLDEDEKFAKLILFSIRSARSFHPCSNKNAPRFARGRKCPRLGSSPTTTWFPSSV